jgi:hypothetical protein
MPQTPPPNPTAAEPDGRRVLSWGGVADHEVTPKAPLTGSGWREYSYGGFGGGHFGFHMHTGDRRRRLTSLLPLCVVSIISLHSALQRVMLVFMPVSNDLAEITSPKSRIHASRARYTFARNSVDITAFFTIHQHFVKAAPNNVKRHAYILNKATYVLVASLWEAYCQDVVAEALDLLVDHAPTWRELPRPLARDIAKELRHADTPLFAAWGLAGDGWRQYIKDRQTGRAYQRKYDFSGPKSANIERFFSESLGLPGIRDAWRQAEGPDICSDLDAHLDRRNNIVHKILPGPMVNKRDVKAFYAIVRRLVKCTDQVTDELLIKVTGRSRWKSYVKGGPVEMEAHDPHPEDDLS